jgi:aryl-alcohol dehydrogenase-like predicted oxidoreductase
MRYMTFGTCTGLRVSEYALGAANFGAGCGTNSLAANLIWGRRGDGAEGAEARKIFEGFAEAGGTLIDTADCYQFGQSEQLVGEFIAADRGNFVLSTKFTNGASMKPRISSTGNSRKNIVQSVEASLRRLNTDYIDLYWAHFPDAVTPAAEILAALDDLVRAGKILYAGLSNFPAWRVSRAVTMAELRGWSPVIGIQMEYSLVERTADRELVPMAESLGLGVALWSPLAGGLLTGRYRRCGEGWVSEGNRRVIRAKGAEAERKDAILGVVLTVAEETGLSAAEVSVAWMRERATRVNTAFVPIIGPRTVSHLDGYLGALDIALTGEQFSRLDEVSAVALGVPHEICAIVLGAVLGGADAGRMSRPATAVA